VIAIDTNILVYAHRADSPFHDRAQSLANLAFIAEEAGHLVRLESLAVSAKTQGGAIHDARIAAICLSHGVVGGPRLLAFPGAAGAQSARRVNATPGVQPRSMQA